LINSPYQSLQLLFPFPFQLSFHSVKETGQAAALASSNVLEETPLTSSNQFEGVERLGASPKRCLLGFSDNKESKSPPLGIRHHRHSRLALAHSSETVRL
jgi:hypothetical protein